MSDAVLLITVRMRWQLKPDAQAKEFVYTH